MTASRLLLAGLLSAGTAGASAAQTAPSTPRLHHAHLNSVDPEAAAAWYARVWPGGRVGVVGGVTAFVAEMPLLFDRVDAPPPGAWDPERQRSEPQSPFWHIGGFVDTTDRFEALESDGITVLRLEPGPGQGPGVVRSGLTPYAGIHTADEVAEAERADPRPGGFGYLVGPDGALVELTGSPRTTPAWAHVHLFHTAPRCAANWYVEVLGFAHAPGRDPATGEPTERERWDPCDADPGPRGFPSLERAGTIRSPAATVVHGSGSISFYPRQGDAPLVPSRGQVLDHVAFAVDDLDAWEAHLETLGVAILRRAPFGEGRSLLLEGPDGLALELVQEGGP